MAEQTATVGSDSFVRRNREAELDAKLDEAEQRSFDLLERARRLAPGDLEDALNGTDEDEHEHGDS